MNHLIFINSDSMMIMILLLNKLRNMRLILFIYKGARLIIFSISSMILIFLDNYIIFIIDINLILIIL